MRPNTHYSTSLSSSAKTKILAVSKVTAALMLFSLLGLGTLLLATQLHAAEVTSVTSNLYAEKYLAQNNGHLKSLSPHPDTKLEAGKSQEEDNVSMLEAGYDMIGSSSFVAANVSTELALQHGKDIKADRVLVYNKNIPIKTNILKMEATKDVVQKGGEISHQYLVEPSTQPMLLIHYASYWAKLPMPLLGVHIIKLIPADNDGAGVAKAAEVKGLTIIAVINDSPAAKASIVKGDSLLKLGDLALGKPDDLFAAVARYAGQTVAIELLRNDVLVKTAVALNVRQ